jgi:hypothetical protein
VVVAGGSVGLCRGSNIAPLDIEQDGDIIGYQSAHSSQSLDSIIAQGFKKGRIGLVTGRHVGGGQDQIVAKGKGSIIWIGLVG